MTRRITLTERLISYLGALSLVVAAVVLSFLAPPLSAASPFTLFFLAAVLAARWRGLGPGLFVTAVGGLVALLLFGTPPYLLWVPNTLSAFSLTGFLVVSSIAVWATASLRDARERMKRVLDSISEGFTVVDRAGRVVYVNRVAAELAKRRPADMIGKNVFEAFPAGSMPFSEEVRRAMRSGRATRIEVRVPGTDEWLESRIVPSEEGLSAFTRDVTDRKESHHRLGMTLTALARSNQELDKFARTVSHELVQPLGSIKNYAELMKERPDDETQRYATRISEISTRMGDLLHDYLNQALTFSDAGTHERIELDTVLAEVTEELSGTLTGCGASVAGSGLPVFTADPVLLRQLFYSLILSALHECSARRLTFSTKREDEKTGVLLAITPGPDLVTNNGRHPFDQDDEFRIAKRIVELYGGVMTARLEPGPEIEVRFTLPAAVARPELHAPA